MAARMYDNPIQTDHKLQSVIILQTTKQIKHTKTANPQNQPVSTTVKKHIGNRTHNRITVFSTHLKATKLIYI